MRHLQLYNNCPRHHTEWTRALNNIFSFGITFIKCKKIGCHISKYYHNLFWYGDGFPLVSDYGVYCTIKVKCARPAQLSCQLFNYDSKLNILKELWSWHPFIKWISTLEAPYFLKQHPLTKIYIQLPSLQIPLTCDQTHKWMPSTKVLLYIHWVKYFKYCSSYLCNIFPDSRQTEVICKTI